MLTDDNLTLDLETGVVSYVVGENIKREVSSNLVRDVIDNEVNCEISVTSEQNGYSTPEFDKMVN